MSEKPKRPMYLSDDGELLIELNAAGDVYADDMDEWLKTEVLPVLRMSRHILPNSQALGECGQWAWNELDDDAQPAITEGRETISTLIAQLEDTQGAGHGRKGDEGVVT